MKKFVRFCLISFVLTGVFAVAFAGTYLTTNYLKYKRIPLNAEALTTPSLFVDAIMGVESFVFN